MNHGSGWILFQQKFGESHRVLLSILPARKARDDVAAYMEQLYVDRFSSIHQRLDYKKHRKTINSVITDRGGGVMHCGHDPYFHCLYASKIVLKGNVLEYFYRILVNADDPLNPRFEQRSQAIEVET
jgi:hypothetical protein